ncbi:MAG: NBR1-Ig-like domain-containing protein, partial [Anaerolineae bacterium]
MDTIPPPRHPSFQVQPEEKPMESSRFANPFNKIGFHIDDDPEFDSRPLYDWVWQLNVAGIPVFLKAKDTYRPIQQALEWIKGSDVPHTFLYRMCRHRSQTESERPSFNFDEPNYELDPKEAASQHWRAILSNLPSEFDPSQVWLEVLHEPDESYADWLGFFALEIGQIALEQGFRLALFGWGNRQPSREAWYQGGLVEYLHLCQQYPDQFAISLHEYSHNPQTLFETNDSGIGYFQELVAATRDKELQPPTIFISEWGWQQEEIPDPELALDHIHQAAELYAQFPEIRGAALWTLGGQSRVGQNVARLIKPLTDFSLNVRFDGEENVPITEDAGYDSGYDQTTAPITENTDPYDDTPDYDARFLNHVTIADGAEIPPGRFFEKSWRVRNDGRLPWQPNFQIVQQDNTPLGETLSFPLIDNQDDPTPQSEIAPGELITLRINLTSP